MRLILNRSAFLQALIAAGASCTLPAKAAKSQVNKIWAAIVNKFIFNLPKVKSYVAGMGRGMKTLKLRQSAKVFLEQQGRVPDSDELAKLWGAT